MNTDAQGWMPLQRGWRARLPIRPQPLDEYSAALWALENAAFRPHARWFNGNQVPLERGQLVTSLGAMAELFGWSIKRVRGFEERMRKGGFWALRRAPQFTVITISDYDAFCPPFIEEGHSEGQSEGIAGAQDGHTREQVQHLKQTEQTPLRGGARSRKRNGDARVRIDPAWQPRLSPSEAAAKILSKWSEEIFDLELQKFRNHHLTSEAVHDALGWATAWDQWILRSRTFDRQCASGEQAKERTWRDAIDSIPERDRSSRQQRSMPC